ncbi:TetR/AcrR family transcriptional regulator [Xanthobacteraceae bacterium A53D]
MTAPQSRELATGAGQDPEKRRQIMTGARQVFLDRGFDAASMGDIARAAGVSKGTLYVYFEDKVDLFSALVMTECDETAERLFELDSQEPDLHAALTRIGISFVEALIRPSHVATVRMVIAIGDKFPEIGRRFLEAGPTSGVRRLSQFLRVRVERGELAIDDTDIAAGQFFALSKDTILAPVLFGAGHTIDRARIEQVVERGVTFFLRVYAAQPADAPAVADA